MRLPAPAPTAPFRLSQLVLPLGVCALVAVGVHAGADLVDDRLLRVVEAVDAWLDGLWSRWPLTAHLVELVDARQRVLLARGAALAWELVVDVAVVLPLLGAGWVGSPRGPRRRFAPMVVLRPLVTLVFAVTGSYGVSRLTEGTLYLALSGDVASPVVAGLLSRGFGLLAMALVLVSHAVPAVQRAFVHARARSDEAKVPAVEGLWGSVFALPLAFALLVEAPALLALVR
jgi:hypothetical protein